MEFLRFGSSIPGSYWGCCACCIIQNFKVPPSQKYAVSLVGGDGGNPIMSGREQLFAGPTYEDVFRQRIRNGTFSQQDMPNHAFFAILTAWQVSNSPGKEWLKILKKEGFEFIRTVDNSVYSGSSVISEAGQSTVSSHENYIFGLFRNIGTGAVKDPYQPPKAWLSLEEQVPEMWSMIEADSPSMNTKHQAFQLNRWAKKPSPFLKRSQIPADVPIHMAGQRSEFPQEVETNRVKKQEAKAAKAGGTGSSVDPFGKPAPTASSTETVFVQGNGTVNNNAKTPAKVSTTDK